MDAEEQIIHVEVCYALPEDQLCLPLKLPVGTTVEQALERSNITMRFPELDLAHSKVGIYGKVVKPEAQLRDGDRIEIYRPLLADPKEVRRRRAAEGKTMKKGAGEAAAA